jgi:cation diffusion facilitator family transporter
LSHTATAFEPRLRGPIVWSIIAAILTILLKGTAYLLTGSVGLFADALESFVNLMAGLTAYGSLWYASRPADKNHTFGHEKIEFFSSGLEGVLVCIAGLGTAFYAIKHIIYPEPLQSLEIGGAIALIASVINFIVAWRLLRVGREMNSLVLEANGQHLMTDVYTSVGVILGLCLVWLTDIKLLDPILAGLIGLHIVWTGLSLVRASFNGLMDHALPEEEQQLLREAIQRALPDGTTFHFLRTRLAGRRKFVDFHLLMDGNVAVRTAHVISHDVEDHLRKLFPELEVTMHVEPIDEESSWESESLALLGEPHTPAPRPIQPPIDD